MTLVPMGFPRRLSSLSCTTPMCLSSWLLSSSWVSYLVLHSFPVQTEALSLGSTVYPNSQFSHSNWFQISRKLHPFCAQFLPFPHTHPPISRVQFTHLLRPHCSLAPPNQPWCVSGHKPILSASLLNKYPLLQINITTIKSTSKIT